MKRKIIIGLLLGMTVITGCTLGDRHSEIKKEIQQELDRTDIEIIDEPNVLIDSEHLADYLWNVRTIGENSISFHVLEDYYGTDGEKIFQTDYDTVQIERVWNEYTFEMLTIDYSASKDGLKQALVTGTYKDDEELNAVYQEIRELCNELNKYANDVSINLYLKFENPLRNKTSYEVDDGDYNILLVPDKNGKYADTLSKVKEEYLLACMEYQFQELLVGMNDNMEIVINKCNRKIGREVDGEITYYDNVCASSYGYGVSFGALYEILQQDGIEIKGDAWHYSFEGTNGKKYEISYDFCNYIYDVTDVMEQSTGEQVYGYYYLMDEEKIPMDEYYKNHFDKEEIEGMTGLKLVY